MNTKTTHPRKHWKLLAGLAALLGTIGLLAAAARTPSVGETYACNTPVTVRYNEPVKLTKFAQDTDPHSNWREWKRLLIERNHLYTEELNPNQRVQLPTKCKQA